jgi:hypothetical protein
MFVVLQSVLLVYINTRKENIIVSVNNSLKNLMELDFEPIRCDPYYGFYDWFCEDHELKNRSEKLISKLKCILKINNKFDFDKTYVFFKNNCPLVGDLYDDFRICDLSDGEVLYTVKINDPSANNLCTIWSYENDFIKPVARGYWNDIVDYFKQPSKRLKLDIIIKNHKSLNKLNVIIDIDNVHDYDDALDQIEKYVLNDYGFSFEYGKDYDLDKENFEKITNLF